MTNCPRPYCSRRQSSIATITALGVLHWPGATCPLLRTEPLKPIMWATPYTKKKGEEERLKKQQEKELKDKK